MDIAMTEQHRTTPGRPDNAVVDPADLPALVAEQAKGLSRSEAFQAQIFKAISVQRPVVLEYLRSVRRDKPGATPADLLKELDSRYVATVTLASSGVGASAMVPGVGIPIALGLGVADLLFFYETSALYVLAVAELHDIPVDDAERAQPLVLGMLLGEKSQSQVSKLVMAAVGAGGVDQARTQAASFVSKTVPNGWGAVLTEQLPESSLAPLTLVIARQAASAGGKVAAGTLGKAIPFGVGAVIGGLGSYSFGRDVVKAAHIAFPDRPTAFPEWLNDFSKAEREPAEQPRALVALQDAAGSAKDFGEEVWSKIGQVTEAFRSVDLDGDGIPDEARALTAVKRAGSAVAGTAGAVGSKTAGAFKAIDLDGDGIPDEPQALAAVKGVGGAVAGAAGAVGGKAAALFKRKKRDQDAVDGAAGGESAES